MNSAKQTSKDPNLSTNLIKLGLSPSTAKLISEKWKAESKEEPSRCWKKMVDDIFSNPNFPKLPFQVHKLLYNTVYPDWNKMPQPAWFPREEDIEQSNLGKVIKEKHLAHYKSLHRWSVSHYQEFWHRMVLELNIQFDHPYSSIVEFKHPKQDERSNKVKHLRFECPNWFVDAKMNIVNSCFKGDSDFRKNSIAIISQNEHGVVNQTTYDELDQLSSLIASGLGKKFKKGDKIAIIMPMTKNAIAIYLAIIKFGGIVVSIAESFSVKEIAVRLKLTNTKAVFAEFKFSRDEKVYFLYEKIVEANAPQSIILGKDEFPTEKNDSDLHLRKQDVTFETFLSECADSLESMEDDLKYKVLEGTEGDNIDSHKNIRYAARSCNPNDHINILFSSGTTGEPKLIPWTHTTPIKCAADAYWHHNLQPGDIFCWPTSLGWMMGPWSIFACFINKVTLAIFEGTTNIRSFGQFIETTGVTHLGVIPTIVNRWRRTGCMEGLDWSKIKLFTSTGECSNIDDMLYLMYLGQYRPVIEYCGGTEIGGAYITGTVIEPCAPAAFTIAAMGIDFVIFDEEGKLSNNGEVGIIGPSVGLSTELLNEDHHDVYYNDMPKLYSNIEHSEHHSQQNSEHQNVEADSRNRYEYKLQKNDYLQNRKLSNEITQEGILLRRHGDHIIHYSNGFYRLLGRTDDTMNLSGIKVGSAEIERVINMHPCVHESAAIGVSELEGGPNQLIIYCELPNDVNLETLHVELQNLIKEHLNPLFKIHKILKIDSLPRTASNKIIRKALRDHFSSQS